MTQQDAQTWLNNTFPENQRRNIQELHIFRDSSQGDADHRRDYRRALNKHYLSLNDSLTGSLDLSTFPQLRKLSINKQLITHLDLTNCEQLRDIRVAENFLGDIVWPDQAPQLSVVDLNDNNLSARDLSCFANFPSLEYLFLGTADETRINYGMYNRWYGSLIYLHNLEDLLELDINATDIDSGLIHLPTVALFHFTFGNCGRTNAGVDRLKEVLENAADLPIGMTMEEWATDEMPDESYHSLWKIEIIRRWQQEARQQWWQQLQAQIQVNIQSSN